MLKCNSIQIILADIANIKFLLTDEKDQNQTEDGKQGIKEIKMKLRKKYNEFYLIYFQNKMTNEWVDEERTSEPWLKKYQNILNGEDVSYMKKNNNLNIYNNNYNNNQLKEKSQRINKNVDRKNIYNNDEYDNSKNYNNNYENNYNDDYSNNYINEENFQDKLQMPKLYRDDERPIKPMKNNNFMNSENPFRLSKDGLQEDHIKYNNYTNQKNNVVKKSKINRNSSKKQNLHSKKENN